MEFPVLPLFLGKGRVCSRFAAEHLLSPGSLFLAHERQFRTLPGSPDVPVTSGCAVARRSHSRSLVTNHGPAPYTIGEVARFADPDISTANMDDNQIREFQRRAML
ncbi:hypothetical protein NDU88_001487 [Pleurodeles waltl]|uniref:Uncharacterized protein n=1 Tax=Pleurodeles waltl TaxID=8319 RepID=A0AAV7TIP1_PLEWA|nr:hypothetical protein NDU88_001487 [Pleurodeles waltl]